MNKDQKKLEESFKNTLRSVLMYAILSILLFATTSVTHWIILEYIAIAGVIVTLVYVVILIYLMVLIIRIKK